MLWDIDALRAQWEQRGTDPMVAIAYGPGEDVQKHTHAAADAR
jgi:acetone carboxylase gamma subunit